MIRKENHTDVDQIRRVTTLAFDPVAYSDGTEPAIIDMLRDTQNMSLSLVKTDGGNILGHVAFSLVLIAGNDHGWYGLGPVCVLPHQQKTGIGSALINTGLGLLKEMDAQGCVVLGDPDYYQRFGFENTPDLRFIGAPARNFMALSFTDKTQAGDVTYDKAFYAEFTSKC